MPQDTASVILGGVRALDHHRASTYHRASHMPVRLAPPTHERLDLAVRADGLVTPALPACPRSAPIGRPRGTTDASGSSSLERARLRLFNTDSRLYLRSG